MVRAGNFAAGPKRASRRAAIIKPLALDPVVPERGETVRSAIMTMSLQAERVARADPEQLSLAPQLLQHHIDKAYELRVAIVDDTIIPFRIRSQERELPKTDWREGLGFVELEPCELSAEVRSNLRRFMRRMGLFCGSIDLIVGKAQRTWFLECNQDGQWAWLDSLVGGAVAQAFAHGFAAKVRERQLCGSFSRAVSR